MNPLKLTTALALSLLVLAGCAPSRPPAPVEIRGVGSGETRPGMAARTSSDSYSSSYSSNSPAAVEGGTYTPPPGYGGSKAVQTETLGEPNDAYAQAAKQPAPTSAPAAASPFASPSSAPTYQAQDQHILGQMNGTTPQSFQSIPQTPPAAPSPAPAVTPQAAPTILAPAAPAAAPAPAVTTNITTAPAGVQGVGDYGWPLRGRLISGFGPKSGGQANDGLNIAAPFGTPAFAAKDGTVAYAGNELRSFGNMVLIRHTGGMFTVYAHLDQILVQKGMTVVKGQSVGTVGQSGGVSEPQLHFEVRKGSTPQDPMKFLGK